MRRLLLAILLAFCISNISCGHLRVNEETTKVAKKQTVVVLYAADWCWWCEEAEIFLSDNNIPYVKKDIEDPDNFEELRQTAIRINYKRSLKMVPLFVVEDEIVAGFDPIGVLLALEIAKFKDQ